MIALSLRSCALQPVSRVLDLSVVYRASSSTGVC